MNIANKFAKQPQLLGTIAFVVAVLVLSSTMSVQLHPFTLEQNTATDDLLFLINPEITTSKGFTTVLLTFDDLPGSQIIQQVAKLGGQILRRYTTLPILSVKVPNQVIDLLTNLPGLKAIEEDQTWKVDVIPNDPSFNQLWGMTKIKAPEAWDINTGSRQVVVAVIDEGIDINHPDLAANIWTNPGEIPNNGIDDDGNGYVDDIHGWDFFYGDNSVYDGGGEDKHGTHVAGTIGAIGNNGIGVAGVNWQVKIMALKFLGPNGGSTTDAISAIEYATMMGADIISASWGGGGYSSALKAAIDNFPGLFVAAAGNDGLDNDASPHYPSSYSSPNILAVAATDSSDKLAYFSNYGATSVDIAAPGVSILSTQPGNSYASFSGTSMATPHVSGAAALLLANDPSLTTGQLKAALMDYADPVPALQGKVASGGRLNVFNAISGTPPPPPPPPPPTTTETFTGTVSSGSPDVVHTFDVGATGDISATLSWSTSADLDMYLYEPGVDPYGPNWVTRAYTLNNPETITWSATQTGTWSIRVNHYSGVSSSYTLEVTHPIANNPPPDTTPPTVTINSPTGTVSGTVTVDATANDDVGVTAVEYRVDGGTWTAMTNAGGSRWTASLDTTTLADGSHTIEVRARDAAGNTGTDSGTFTVNNAPPPPPSSSVSLDSHSEQVKRYRANKKQLQLKSTLTGTVSGSPTDVVISITFPSSWNLKSIKKAELKINGVKHDVKSLVVQNGNTISVDITSYLSDGVTFQFKLETDWKNVNSGTYNIDASLSFFDGTTTQTVNDRKTISF